MIFAALPWCVDSRLGADDNCAMAEATQPPKVKLICGMISARKELFDEAARPLEAAFGPVDLASDVMDFDFTHYYDQTMGSPLFRRFLSFPTPDFTRIAGRGQADDQRPGTGDFAARVSRGQPPRPINLDPGYLDHAKLVLASMKDFSHRFVSGPVRLRRGDADVPQGRLAAAALDVSGLRLR